MLEKAIKTLRKHNIKIKDYSNNKIVVYESNKDEAIKILKKKFILENKNTTIILQDKKEKKKCNCGKECCKETTTSSDVAVDVPAVSKKVSFKDYLFRRKI